MGKICGTVEKSVEKLWEKCVNHVEIPTIFPHDLYYGNNGMVEKVELYTFFMNSCGTISTGGVNKYFGFYRYETSCSSSFPQFPHSLLLQLLNII